MSIETAGLYIRANQLAQIRRDQCIQELALDRYSQLLPRISDPGMIIVYAMNASAAVEEDWAFLMWPK